MRWRALVAATLAAGLAGCGGRERRDGGPSNAGPEHAGATGRTRPGGAAPEAEAPAQDDAERPEPPAGSVTSFDVEAAAAKLAADVRARRADLGPEPVVSLDRVSNESGNTNVDMGLVQALVVRALLPDLGVKTWRGLLGYEHTFDMDMDALARERKATLGLTGVISRERTRSDGQTTVTLTYDLALARRAERTVVVKSTSTVVRTREDDDRPGRPPAQPARVDLGAAIAACARDVAAAKPARVELLPVDNRTPRRLDDLGPALAGRLSASGVPATVQATEPEEEYEEPAEEAPAEEAPAEEAPEEEAPEEEAPEEEGGDDYASSPSPSAQPPTPPASHLLLTQLYEESWTSDDGERYASVVAVFILVDKKANEVKVVSVTRVRG